MKKHIAVLMSAILATGLLVSGCAEDNGDGGGATILFEDHFSYNAASPWTPVNGWSGSSLWYIVAGGVSGNALEYPGIGIDPLTNSFSGTDYQVSVRIKPVNMHAGGWPNYVMARVQDDDNWYAAGIYEDSTDTYLTVTRNVNGSTSDIGSQLFKTGLLDSSTYYTLTLRVEGSTITATCSGEGLSATTSATDTTHADGMVGIMVWDNPGAYSILFDDFVVYGL